jgi:hypothetical protein
MWECQRPSLGLCLSAPESECMWCQRWFLTLRVQGSGPRGGVWEEAFQQRKQKLNLLSPLDRVPLKGQHAAIRKGILQPLQDRRGAQMVKKEGRFRANYLAVWGPHLGAAEALV